MPTAPCASAPSVGVVNQDLLLELTETGTGFEPQFVGEQRAHPLVGGERIGLAPGPVEGGDEQLPEHLVEGERGDRGLELADDVVAAAEVDGGGQVGLGQLHSDLVEARAMRDDPLGVAGGREELAGEASECRRAHVGGTAEVTGEEEPG